MFSKLVVALLIGSASAFAPTNVAFNKVQQTTALQASALEQTEMAQPYAKALMDFATENKALSQVSADVQQLQELLKELGSDADLIGLLSSPATSRANKKAAVDAIFSGRINAETKKFLDVLVDKDRIDLLEPILAHYMELMYDAAGIKKVSITTAHAFTKEQKQQLSDNLKGVLDARGVQITVDVDPDLIGGFKVTMGTKTIDLTIKSQLESMAKHLGTTLEV